jgi:hypothetical protein
MELLMKRSLVLLALLAPLPAAAQNYPVAMGAGLSPCSQYLRLHRQDPSMVDAYFVWAQGYLSGLNDRYVGGEGTPANLQPLNLSTDEQKAFLDRYCRSHAEAPYMQGVVALFQQMRKDQGIPAAAPAAPAPAAQAPAHPPARKR